MNWLNTKSGFVRPNTPAPGVTRRGVYDFDSYDLLISAGPTMNFNGWKIYGGPFYYYLNGDYKLKTRDDGVLVYTEKADVKADRNWGAFIGSIINLGQNIDWTVEYATTGKGWGLGTGIAWTF